MNSIKLLSIILIIFNPYINCWQINNNQQQQENIVEKIANNQLKYCELNNDCFDCWRSIDKQLILKKLSFNNGNNNFCHLPTTSSISLIKKNEKNFCCQLWQTFDCRTDIATKYCTLNGYINYRHMLIDWANRLMTNNLCTTFDYHSEQCNIQQQQQQQSKILDEFVNDDNDNKQLFI